MVFRSIDKFCSIDSALINIREFFVGSFHFRFRGYFVEIKVERVSFSQCNKVNVLLKLRAILKI